MPKVKQPILHKPKKDPGVPNLRVQKAKLAHQVEMHKAALERQNAKEAEIKEKILESRPLAKGKLSSFAKAAAKKEREFENKKRNKVNEKTSLNEKQSSKCLNETYKDFIIFYLKICFL